MKKRILSSITALLLCAALLPCAMAADAPQPEARESVTWEELSPGIREGNHAVLALTDRINGIKAIDYEQMMNQMREQINGFADAQWRSIMLGDSLSAYVIGSASQSLIDVFDTIRDGDMQKDNADAVRQMEEAVNQVVAAGQKLYIGLLAMERSAEDGRRGIEALDRSLTELRLRRDLGQVSDQAVLALEQQRASAVSQLKSLDTSISDYASQLQTLMGAPATGKLSLGGLPEISAEEFKAIDYAAGLAAAKEASFSLYSAKLTLDDAREEWVDTRYDSRYQREMAEHTWKAAQNTYKDAVLSFEASFLKLYNSLADYQQLLESRESAVAYQQRQLEIAQAKYDRGMLSYSALLSAKDAVADAVSAAEGARADLFAAYNSYKTAVEYGII